MKIIPIILLLQLFVFIGFSQSSDSKLITDSLHSEVLDETRTFCVYFPPFFDSQKKYPVIYCADGQKITENNYKAELDSLISSKLIEPTVLIGLNSNEKSLGKNTTYRQVEYIKNFQEDSLSQQRFENHLQFFLKEAPEYIQNKYNIQEDSTKRTFYGTSNGGGFGMTMFFEGGYNFKNFICFSPLGCIKSDRRIKKKYPNLYISYGTEELFILVDEYKELVTYLEQNKVNFHSTPYSGGHKDLEWIREFTNTMLKIHS